ncbi:MAG: hypothetical protein QM570_15415 [Planctomycetota bacterium]|jgi:hypothetical protein|nr:hypothetical protein [Planctomycetota bacterium]
MSRRTYAWYRIPDRLALGLYALAVSLWRDWFPRHTCARCKWRRTGRAGDSCNREIGYGYGRRLPEAYTCKHWEGRK